MKAKFYITMYSGLPDPEAVLSEDLSDKIAQMVLPLDKPFAGNHLEGLASLAPNHYMVYWEEGPILVLRAQPYGYLHIWRSLDGEGQKVQDTAGIWAFLNGIGGYLLQQHNTEILKAMEKYVSDPGYDFFNLPPLDIY